MNKFGGDARPGSKAGSFQCVLGDNLCDVNIDVCR